MKADWKKNRSKAVKHARLMKKKPELREALYGRRPATPTTAGTRETAQRGQNDD